MNNIKISPTYLVESGAELMELKCKPTSEQEAVFNSINPDTLCKFERFFRREYIDNLVFFKLLEDTNWCIGVMRKCIDAGYDFSENTSDIPLETMTKESFSKYTCKEFLENLPDMEFKKLEPFNSCLIMYKDYIELLLKKFMFGEMPDIKLRDFLEVLSSYGSNYEMLISEEINNRLVEEFAQQYDVVYSELFKKTVIKLASTPETEKLASMMLSDDPEILMLGVELMLLNIKQ